VNEGILEQAFQTKDGFHALLSQAEEALSAMSGSDVRMFLPNLWKDKVGVYEIVGIGAASSKKYALWGPRTRETFLWFRTDYFFVKAKAYSHSVIRKRSIEQVTRQIDSNGEWAEFLADNVKLEASILAAFKSGSKRPDGCKLNFED
jgi:hypothetical protein